MHTVTLPYLTMLDSVEAQVWLYPKGGAGTERVSV